MLLFTSSNTPTSGAPSMSILRGRLISIAADSVVEFGSGGFCGVLSFQVLAEFASVSR